MSMFSGRRANPKTTPVPETPSTRVRKEWKNFLSSWYEPEKKKREEELQKELNANLKKIKTQSQRKARDDEKDKKLKEIQEELAGPARQEWENRLEKLKMSEEQWVDITEKEQEEVSTVFTGLYDEEEEPVVKEENTTVKSAADDNVAFEAMAKQFLQQHQATEPSTVTPPSATFGFVNPASFFHDAAIPSYPTKGLPPLHPGLADTLSNLDESNGNAHASGSGLSSGTHAVNSNGWGFSGWAAEAGLPSESAKKATASFETRAEKMSRQSSSASTQHSTQQSRPSPPQTSSQGPSPQSTTRSSPTTQTEKLSPGKQYVGPVLLDEDAVRLEHEAFNETKVAIRIQMIEEFHKEAATIEIELVQHLTPEVSKEDQRKLVEEHEQKMRQLRVEKETQRKALVEMARQQRLLDISRRNVGQKASTQRGAGFLDVDNTNALRPQPSKAQMTQPSQAASGARSNPKQDDSLQEGILFSRSTSSSHSNVSFDPRLNFMQEEGQKDFIPFSRSNSSDPSSTSAIRGILKKPAQRVAEEPSPVVEIEALSPAPAPTPVVVAPPPEIRAEAPKGKKGKKGQAAKVQPKVEEKPPIIEPPPVSAVPKPSANGKMAEKNKLKVAEKQGGKLQNQPLPASSKATRTSASNRHKATVEDCVEENEEWSEFPAVEPEVVEPAPDEATTDTDVGESGKQSWYGDSTDQGGYGYWNPMAKGAAPSNAQATEQQGQHARWVPPSLSDDHVGFDSGMGAPVTNPPATEHQGQHARWVPPSSSDDEGDFDSGMGAGIFGGGGDDMEREVFFYQMTGGAFTTDGLSAAPHAHDEAESKSSSELDFAPSFPGGFPGLGDRTYQNENVMSAAGKGKGKEKARQEQLFGAKKTQENPWGNMEAYMSASARMGGKSSRLL